MDRKLDLSSKFLQMGNALMKEGEETKDFSIIQSGTLLILVGSLLLDNNDMLEFMNLCSMFTSKKILDDIESDTNSDISNYLKNHKPKESYDDFIKRLNKIRGNNNSN